MSSSSQPANLTSAPAFERATAVRPLGEGRFAGEVDAGWSAPTGPNGGYLAAIVTRALEAHVDPAGELRLRSLTCHYLRPATPGEIAFDVELVRAGRRLATGRLRGIQDGREVLTALAAFAVPDLAAAASWSPAPPAVAPAPAHDAPSVPVERYRADDAGAWLQPPPGTPPISQQARLAPRFGGVPFSGRALAPGEAAEAGGWMALPEPRALDAALVALCTDLWWPPSFEPLSRAAIAPTIDLTIHVRATLPAGGLPHQAVLGRYRTSAALGGLIEEDGELFLADGTLLAQSRQLALLAPLG